MHSHLSGDNISLPHMLSHLGNLAKTKQKQLSALGVNCTMSHMFIHLYHNGHKRDATDMDELGYSFNRLATSPTDLDEMQRAYLGDDSVHLAVLIKTIYRIIALDNCAGINPEAVKKVNAWKDTVFFAYTAPDTTVPLLYTPTSMQLLMWPNDAVTTLRHRI